MDVTIDHYIELIAMNPNPKYWKTKKYIKQLMSEVYAYRSTAYLYRGTNISRMCNWYAKQIENKLNKVLQ